MPVKTWEEIIDQEKKKPYFKDLWTFLEKEYQEYEIYPKKVEIFSALKATPFEQVKVIILGQDPYHGENQAHGLAFSVKEGSRIPGSLANIYKEMQADLGLEIPKTGYLLPWARQGVLLINTVLTVRANQALSHRNKGWEVFTRQLIAELNKDDKAKVFVLWGREAQKMKELLSNKKHLILKAAHPSPLSASRGFFGCRHFSKANKFLEKNNLEKIDWEL